MSQNIEDSKEKNYQLDFDTLSDRRHGKNGLYASSVPKKRRMHYVVEIKITCCVQTV